MTNEDLAAAIRSGRKEYVLQLWRQVERFIGQQAGRYMANLDKCRGVEEDDLKQAGFLALLDAVNQYDPEGGASFVYYLSFHLHRRFVEAAGLRTERTAADPISSPISLDQPIEGGDGATLGDLQPDPQNGIEEAEERLQNDQLRAALDKALSTLNPEDAEILRQRFFENKTLKDIATAGGVSISWIREREARGLRGLRKTSNTKALEAYLDIRTPYYMATRRDESPIEKIVLRRERLRNLFAHRENELYEIKAAAKQYRRLEKA